MTTLQNRPSTALLVIDVQVGVVRDAYARDAVVATIGRVVAKAREAGVPVVWVQHDADDLPKGDDDWQIAPELQPAAGETRIEKRYGDAFEDTELEAVLARLKVGRLVVTGAETDACIRSTIHGAFTRGYDVTLVSDAHTAGDKSQWGAPPVAQVIAHTNLYWTYQAAPGRTAGTVASQDLAFDRAL